MDVSPLVDFLNDNSEVYQNPNTNAKIIVADDQYVSQEAIKHKIADRDLSDRLQIFSNGQEVVDYFEELLKGLSEKNLSSIQQPVSLVLIDINMPILSGLETVPIIKRQFAEFNDALKEGPLIGSARNFQIVRPPILYFSQHDRVSMSNFISKEEVSDFYLEKPV